MVINEFSQAESHRRISSTLAVIGRMSVQADAWHAMTCGVRRFRQAARANRTRGWRAFTAAIAFVAAFTLAGTHPSLAAGTGCTVQSGGNAGNAGNAGVAGNAGNAGNSGGNSGCPEGGLLAAFIGNLISDITGHAVSAAVGVAVDTALGTDQMPGQEPLGYANAFEAISDPVYSPWSIWGDARGTGTSGPSGFGGSQLNGFAGIGYRLTPDLVVGALTGYELFDNSVSVVSSTLSGSGGTIGGYFGWRPDPHWTLDGILAWSGLHYDSAIAGVTGSFTAGRILASVGASAKYDIHRFEVRPSGRVYALWESRAAWTDSASTLQPAQGASAGRGSIGATVGYPMAIAGAAMTPYVGVFGDYRFASSSAALVSGDPSPQGVSARVNGGVNVALTTGARLGVEVEFGGLGSSYTRTAARVHVDLPL